MSRGELTRCPEEEVLVWHVVSPVAVARLEKFEYGLEVGRLLMTF